MRILRATDCVLRKKLRSTQSVVCFCICVLLPLFSSCVSREFDAVYHDAAIWLDTHALPYENVAVPGEAKGIFGERETTVLPVHADAFALLDTLDEIRPDYVLAPRSVAWGEVKVHPWFMERYHTVASWPDVYSSAAPWELFAYTPSRFDRGTYQPLHLGAEFGELTALRGMRLNQARIIPGEPLHLTLYWDDGVDVDFAQIFAGVELVSQQDARVWAHTEEPLSAYAMIWTSDTRLATHYVLVPPKNLPFGQYELAANLQLQDVTVELPSARMTLAMLEYLPNVSRKPSGMGYALNLKFGEVIEMAGCDLPVRATPGETIRVTVLWHATGAIEEDYKVFVHFRAPDDSIIAQSDAKPVNWTYPTTEWQVEDYILDEHLLQLPADLPRGKYAIVIGMYAESTGERLPIFYVDGTQYSDGEMLLPLVPVW